MTDATPFLPGLSPLGRKALTAERDAGNLTSNGGLIVLRESALRSEVAAVVADAVPDRRNPLLVTHSYRAMVTARMMAIAAGYEDADDLDALRFDPALMLACNREPEGGHGIPSQPTVSRLENVADAGTLYRIGIGYIDFFCRSYATPPHSIVLDIDDGVSERLGVGSENDTYFLASSSVSKLVRKPRAHSPITLIARATFSEPMTYGCASPCRRAESLAMRSNPASYLTWFDMITSTFSRAARSAIRSADAT